MFLKKLVINGFKSFCDYQEITFVKGISAIVGPNGCGKSNVVDAIKWVVGEQKVKMMRANSMTDVIFAGTEQRKGLGRAEVRLTIVNEQNILPIDYNEVEISRVIYASGENEYYINKKRVRYKDVQELFFDTGVGKNSYSVMAQGKIDLILSNKPEDRRYIIEEAAGITKYRVKREEAVSRLKETDENIIRIKDIIEEVKTQYEHMKKQAERAELFTVYHDREISLEIELNLNRIMKQKRQGDELIKKVDKTTADLENIKKELDDLETGIENQMNHLTQYENQKIENQREIFKLQSDLKISNSKKDIMKEQIRQYDNAIKNDQERIKVFENNIKDIDEELDEIEYNRKEMDEKIISINQDLDFYSSNITEIEDEITAANLNIKELKNRISVNNQNLETKRNEQKKATENLVLKIDQSINVFDANAEQIIRFKKNLDQNITYILTHLPSKRAFISDIIRGGYLSKESNEFFKTLETLRDELLTIENKVSDVDKDIKSYIQNIEGYLNDIFGSDGLLSLKRGVEYQINTLTDKINEDTNKIEKLQQEINLKRDKKDSFGKVVNELNINLSTLREKKNSFDNDIKRLLSMKSHYKTNKDEVTQKLQYYQEKKEEVEEEILEIEGNLICLNEKKQKIEKHLLELDELIKEQNAQMSSQQLTIKNINNKWQEKKSELEKLHIKLAEAHTTITNVYDTFYENFSINLEEQEAQLAEMQERSYDEIKKELTEVKTNKHSLGNVNLMAIEESRTLAERYNLLKEQLEDLEKAKQDIQEMIVQINKVSHDLFVKTFKEVRVNFQKIFKKLFDGGNADMSLTIPDNIIETGVDVIAHPPGQKSQSITLLSGGQRTMTAIAIMFAVYLVKPSPFCLLDEIDAALDEENIRRFISLLADFKEMTQFVIITHNSKTISAADVMYGVTQEHKGVSKIVSAKFAKQVS